MRNIIFFFVTMGLLLSCNNDKKSDGENTQTNEKANAATSTGAITELKQSPLQIAVKPYEKLIGSFVGPFGNNKITMLITIVAGDSVVGRTIVGGNDRPFRGTFKRKVRSILLVQKSRVTIKTMVNLLFQWMKRHLIRCGVPGSLLLKTGLQKNIR